MNTYTSEDIQVGFGSFEHAMRSQTTIPGVSGKVSPGVAIGILSAAMRSGLNANKIEQIIHRDFAHSAPLLSRILVMYEGDDWDINLWHKLPSRKFKLCTDLCRPNMTGWRYTPSVVDI